MSYTNKINNYQGDCKILLGKYPMFSDYVKNFSITRRIGSYGLDLGTGPGGCNGSFFTLTTIDGCDAEKEVLKSLSTYIYNKIFYFVLGKDQLPYINNSLDYIVCSCVIQHLNNFSELEHGLNEIFRVLKTGGNLFLMFKVGSNDTLLTHFNSYYSEERSFRVFSQEAIKKLSESLGFKQTSCDYLLDENHIPYCCNVFVKH